MFEYILDKIENAKFSTTPFKHLYIEDFLEKEHFDIVTNCKQIKLQRQENTNILIRRLIANNYRPTSFPGCTTDINQYLKLYNSKEKGKFKDDLTEGLGISFRLQRIENNFIKELIKFLNSEIFIETLMRKFDKNLNDEIYIETAIQKYMSGYEISPHPDIRKKVLTYMLNINTDEESEKLNIHTKFLKFKKQYEWIYDFWKKNPDTERCWVPWNWCDSFFEQSKNNSISIFAPTNDTLHSIKLDYDHDNFQRTQIYGNVWYKNYNNKKPFIWKDFL